MEQDSGIFIRRIVTNVSDAMLASDPEFGIVEWNPAAEKMYGYTREEARGKQISELARREYIGTTRDEVIEEFNKKGHWEGEVYDYTRDGHRLLIFTRVSTVYDADEKFIGIVAVNRDITLDRMRQVREHQHNQMYRLLAEATAICTTRSELCQYLVDQMVLVLDVKAVMFHLLADDTSDSCVCYSSGAPENLTKALASDTMIQDTLFKKKKQIHVKDLLEFRGNAIWVDVLRQYQMRSILAWPIYIPEQEPIGAVCMLSDKDIDLCNGETNHLENFSNMIATAVHRVATEEKSHQYRQKLQTIFEHIVDVYFRLDPDGTLNTISNSGLELFGLKNESEVLGKHVSEWVFAHSSEYVKFLTELTHKKVLKNYMFIGKTQQDLKLDLEVNARVETDETGELKYIEGLIRDVTERNAMEEEIREKARLENMGFIVGSVAHSFNNNLTAVLGSISVSQHYAGDNAKLVNFLKKAETGCLKAKQTVQQLMMISGSIKPICRSLEIMPLIKSAVAHVSDTCNTDVQVKQLSPLPRLNANEKQLIQVFVHILNNSVEAMHGEGQVTIELETIKADETKQVSSMKMIGQKSDQTENLPIVEFRFMDNGPGIEPDALKRVFEPFFTTHSTARGLGLPVSRAIIRRLDGSITVESCSSGGATVTIRLPGEEIVTADGWSSRSPRILIVDPSDLVRQVFVDLMKELDYQAVGVESGADCLREFRASVQDKDPFGVVFIDLGPRESHAGPGILKMIRKISPDVKVIATTGYGDHNVMNDFHLHGFDEKLMKPFRLSSVEEVLKNLLS